MVDWRHFTGDISAGLNYLRHGGRVPPESESMECRDDFRVCSSWRDSRAGFMDASESSGIIILMR